MQSCDVPYQADTTPTDGQQVQCRRWRRCNYRNALERCATTKHIRRFLQFFAWPGTQEREYCLRRIRPIESWQDPSVFRYRFQPALGCMPNPVDFAAGELRAEVISLAQCTEAAELPADAKANQDESN